VWALLLLNACSEYTTVTIGNDVFELPNENISTIADEKGSRKISGFDSSSLRFSLRWGQDELAREIKSYQPYREERRFPNTMVVSLYAPSKEKLDYMESSKPYIDSYLLRNRYKNAVVEANVKDGTYFVYESSKKMVWAILKIKPNSLKHFPDKQSDFWIGECSDYRDGLGASCVTETTYRNYYLRIEFAGNNWHVVENIKEFVLGELEKFRLRTVKTDVKSGGIGPGRTIYVTQRNQVEPS